MSKTPRYTVIGGIPFRSYTGTGTYTGLKVFGQCATIPAVKKLVKKKYEEMGGLHLVIDNETGKEADIS